MRTVGGFCQVLGVIANRFERVVLNRDPGDAIRGRICFSPGPVQTFQGCVGLATRIGALRARAVGCGVVAVVAALLVLPVGAASAAVPDGSLFAFGDNDWGQLGNATNSGTGIPNPTPALVVLPGQVGSVTQVAAGDEDSLAVTSSGQLYAFGDNDYGQLGSTTHNGTDTPNPTPALVTLPGESGPVTQVAAGGSFSLAVTSSGQLYAFGLNQYGQLGIATNSGTANPNPTPALVTLPGQSGPVTRVAAGASSSLAVTASGQLYAFGLNQYGQLGIATNSGTSTPNPTPALVTPPGESGPVTEIAAGYEHSLAITSSGQLYAFGLNSLGQLGSGMASPNPTPTLVTLPGESGPVTQIAAGELHSLAVTSSGQLYAFGYNYFGQLGNATNNGTANPNPTPVLVTLPGQSGPVTQIAGGAYNSLAVTSSGQLYAFGDNADGQLGSGSANPNPTPALVALPPGTTIATVAKGPEADQTLAITPGVPPTPTPTPSPTPTPAPAPAATPPTPQSCTLKAPNSKVLLTKPKHRHTSKASVGTLSLTATCKQFGTFKLTGVVTELVGHKPKHGKQKTKTFALGPVRGSLAAGVRRTLILKLPKGAVRALDGKAKESVSLTLVATNANGTGRASASIARLKGV